jgi:repressor LexA
MADYTRKQGQYLAFIYYYTKINRRPPAEADMQRFFRSTAPTVHQMVLKLEEKVSLAEHLGKLVRLKYYFLLTSYRS